jgi:uncharacterized membrane protein
LSFRRGFRAGFGQNDPMFLFLVQFLGLFAIALWVGAGAAVVFLVVPATFEGASSRQQAAVLVGTIMRRLNRYALAAGSIALGCALVELLGTRGVSRAVALKASLVGAMLGFSLYSWFVVLPDIERVRSAPGLDDARGAELGRLHALSGLLLIGQTLLGGFAIGLALMSGR